jgi:spermidine synthase
VPLKQPTTEMRRNELENASLQSMAPQRRDGAPAATFTAVIYIVAFVTGAIVMSFEMLGSRYLNPYFGNGIYTWAALISTVLAALTAGYFVGGFIADRMPSASLLGAAVGAASLYLLLLPGFAEMVLSIVSNEVEDVRLGSLYAALATMFVPVTLLGVYSPFAIRLVLSATGHSGTVSGAVYGVSTAGSIAGTLGTTFLLIPIIGTRAITLTLGAAGVGCALILIAVDHVGSSRKGAKALAGLLICAAFAFGGRAQGESLIDESVRAQMLAHRSGPIVHLETEYNDLYISKRGPLLALTTRVKNELRFHSIVDLEDPDDMPVPYTQTMAAALLYPEKVRRILMVGLGAGSISTYLARAMPDVAIDVVELDPGVIAADRKYFGLLETDRVRFIESDGRVYLNRNKGLYDLSLLDAFREQGVPFHLLTREFYSLVKERLAPGGAVASNVDDDTKLYASTLATFGAVFPTLDVYRNHDPEESQSIVVATSAAKPSPETLMQRATALQQQHHFRYPMPDRVGERLGDVRTDGADVLTDDFAPVDIYKTVPLRQQKSR